MAQSQVNELRPPKYSVHDGASNWTKFLQSFQVYLSAAGLEKADEKQQCNLLIYCMGPEGIDIYNTFELKAAEVNKFQVLVDKFNEYFLPKVNVTFERHKFFTRNQKSGENIESYVTELKALAATCDFGKLKDSLIKDRVVCGIDNNKLREKLLTEHNLTLTKCIDICRSAESTKTQLKEINSETIQVNSVKGYDNKKKPDKPSKDQVTTTKIAKNKVINNCSRCGRNHKVNECPAYGAECYKCKKKNHFSKMCKQKQIKGIQETDKDEASSSNDSNEYLFVGTVENKQSREDEKSQDWVETVEVMDSPRIRIKFKLDTGAQANIIPSHVFNRIPKVKLEKSRVRLINYNGSRINNLGMCNLVCNVENKQEKINLDFQIVDSENAPPVLGLQACKKLKLIKRLNEIRSINLLEEFKDVFEGIGCLKNVKHKIIIKENSVPVTFNARKIPLSIKNELKNELDNLERLEIIEKINEPTDWVHPLVVVKKPNGKLRICLDPKELNKVIKREYFQMPTIDDMLAELSGATVFSILDANMGFYQIQLDAESSRLCTFATPFGRYIFKRLPFGISSSPEIFYKNFKQIFDDIPGNVCYIDDLLVYGKDKHEHDVNLRRVLERAREANIKFNKNKCKFNVSEVKFVGHIITNNGVKIDNDKIESILKIPIPRNKKEVEKFLGLVTYVSKFLPGLSEKTTKLRELLNKKVLFVWDENHTKSFNNIKQALTTTPVLQYFDANKPITLSVDASQNGLGATLLQNNLPVSYSSRALTETEKGYAQIEKEMAAVVFGCLRYHQYIYGKKVIVESDHKPLVSIYKKPLIKCPLRLQRMLIKLQAYDIEIVHKKGTQLIIADYLSRNFLNEYKESDKLALNEIEAHVNLIEQILPVSEQKFKLFQKETQNDKNLVELLKFVKLGWPDKNTLNDEIQKYYNYKEELVTINDVIFKGNKIIVPTSLRNETLQLIHYNHLGVTKCQLRARQGLFWPGINDDIEKFVNNCDTCLNFRNSNSNEPLMPTAIPGNVWECVGTDVYQYKGKNFILVIYYFSKFIETMPLEKLDSIHTINALKSIFARHGIPKTIRSDNGTNYSSEVFKTFVDSWNIKHITSSPTHAQSNGMVERAIQTFKNIMKKAEYDNKDPYLCLLEYRTSPIDRNIPSPANLLFNRDVNSLLPKFNFVNKGKGKDIKDVTYNLKNKQEKEKLYFDKNTKQLTEFKINDRVRIQNMDKTWQSGRVLKISEKPRTYIVKLNNGSVLERNRKYLIKDSENVKKYQLKFSSSNNDNISRPRRQITNPKKYNDFDCT